MEKGKISAWQMGVLMYLQSMGTGVLIVPEVTGKFAKNDLWLPPIMASVCGFLVVYMAYGLQRMYPDQTIVQYGERILGRIPGKVLGFGFCFFYLHIAGLMLRDYAEFLAVLFLPKTPVVVSAGCMALVCAFAVRGGIEVIVRAAQAFITVFVLLLLLLIFLLIPDLNPANALPVLEHGIYPSIQGTVRLLGFFTEMLMIAYLFPYVNDRRKGLRSALLSVVAATITMIVLNVITLFLLGRDLASELYPVLTASKYISVADFFENMEALSMAIWVLGIFVKISLFLYVTVLGTAQWLNLADYRHIVFPLGLFTLLLSFWYIPNVSELFYVFANYPFYALLFQGLLPLLLLVVALIRKRIRMPKGG